MTNHHIRFILMIAVIQLQLYVCKEQKEYFQSSTSSFIQGIDSCSDENVNSNSSCRPELEGINPTSIIQTKSLTQDDDISKTKQSVTQSQTNEKTLNNLEVILKKENPVVIVEDMHSVGIISGESTQSAVNKDTSDSSKKPSTNLGIDVVVDKRASIYKGGINTPSGDNLVLTHEKIETNEVIPDSIAEESIMGVTSHDADVNDQTTVLNIIINSKDSMTETPGMTTGGITEANGVETLNTTVIPTLVVKEDEDNKLTHKTAPIPRNSITKVAVQDCPCDVIKNVCDINCCCDNDCSAYDRLVFSHCLPLPSVSSSQYCFSKQLIYINNSPFYVSKHPDNALLCIETENLESKTNFTNLKPITSLKTFAKVFERRKHNEWSRAVLRTTSYSLNRLPHNQSYKVGQPIWMMNSTSVKSFELPCHSILSDACSSEQTVYYLQDSQSECMAVLQECSPNNILSPTFYYKNFLLLASTSFQNLTSVNNCTKQSCLQIEPYSCQDSSCTLITDEILPIWDPGSQTCVNVTNSVEFVFKHNGTQGITKVMLYFGLDKLTLGQNVRLKTKVSFEWYSSYERSFHRSGNPGYRTRAPLISGTRLSFNVSQEDKTIPSINFSPTPQNWITMLSYTSGGECDPNHRRNILFGTNERVMCRFVFDQKQFADCDSIQQHIYKLLLGNLKYFDTDTYIASNGDPSIYNIEDWVPILWTRLPHFHVDIPSLPCGSLATGINIKLIHAYYGAYANPDSKIIAVLIETFKHSTLTCAGLTCSIDLSWASSFVHSRNLPFTKFPEPPVYEIKLPSNFFYPFLSSAESTGQGGSRTVVMLFLVCAGWLVS